MFEWIAFAGMMIVLFAILSLGVASASYAPWVPTKRKDLERVRAVCDLREGDTFMEIGCGNGRVLFYMHDTTAARVIGIERAWPLAAICRIRAQMRRSNRCEIVHTNAFSTDLSRASVVYTFGMPKPLNSKLVASLKTWCKPGTRVISYVFPIEALTPARTDRPTPNDLPIYMYIV